MKKLICVLMLLLLSTPVWAGDDVDVNCIGNSCNQNNIDRSVTTDVTTNVSNATSVQGGSQTIEGSRALALSNSLGDVDIQTDCTSSAQWNTPLFGKQRLVRDETCVGFKWLALGDYGLAKMHFCMDEAVLGQYETVELCEEDHDFTPAPGPTESQRIAYAEAEAVAAAEVEWRTDVEIIQQDYDDKLAQLERDIDRIPEPTQQTIVEERPAFTTSQIATFESLRYEKDDEDE